MPYDIDFPCDPVSVSGKFIESHHLDIYVYRGVCMGALAPVCTVSMSESKAKADAIDV